MKEEQREKQEKPVVDVAALIRKSLTCFKPGATIKFGDDVTFIVQRSGRTVMFAKLRGKRVFKAKSFPEYVHIAGVIFKAKITGKRTIRLEITDKELSTAKENNEN